MEHKSRRPDILVDDELIHAFYEERVPAGIHNGADFEKWRRSRAREPEAAYLKRDDLMRHQASGITTDNFPPSSSGATPSGSSTSSSARAARRRHHTVPVAR